MKLSLKQYNTINNYHGDKMIIHIVKEGETIDLIADIYGVPVDRVIRENQLVPPYALVVGQTIVVLLTAVTHTVGQGDTFLSIAERYNVTILNILQNNPGLTFDSILQVGDTIVISYNEEKKGNFLVEGYAYSNLPKEDLVKTLPYLSMLMIFTYGFTEDGQLIPTDDTEFIALSKQYGVRPFMVLSTLTESGNFSSELASVLFNDETVMNTLVQNIVNTVQSKGYAGVDIDFEFVAIEDKTGFLNFAKVLTDRLNEIGRYTSIALAPKTSADQPGLLYESHDYAAFGEIVNYVFLMTYEWGYAFGPPMAVAPLNKVAEVVSFAVTQIANNKIIMGIPNYGYDWTLPFVRGNQAKSIGNEEAINIARTTGATIEFDDVAMSPYFYYTDEAGTSHVVWFEDARSIQAKLNLAHSNNLAGIGYWVLKKPFPQNWLVLNAQYNIEKFSSES